jgi:hypothetical protein
MIEARLRSCNSTWYMSGSDDPVYLTAESMMADLATSYILPDFQRRFKRLSSGNTDWLGCAIKDVYTRGNLSNAANVVR